MNHHTRSIDRPSISLDIHGAFIRRTDFSHANLENANLSGADAKNALFRNVNFKDTNLDGTNLRGADLTGAKNLTIEQLRKAHIDKNTILPAGITFDRVTGDANGQT